MPQADCPTPTWRPRSHERRANLQQARDAPERFALQIGPNASLLCIAAAESDIGITKIVTVHPDTRTRALPAIQSEVTVFDIETGDGLGTDVVIALTTSKCLVIPAQLPDTTLAIGVGAFRPDMAELGRVLDRDCAVSQPLPYVFKSVGHASWDLAAARRALRNG
jgi:ornithine cyclodeaminase/alanine dehydrogenase-like protein (mu-crystallin family)